MPDLKRVAADHYFLENAYMESRERDIKNTLRGLLWMILLAGLVAGFLAAGNWLPSLAQKGFARQYANLDEAKRAIGLDTVLVPSYFPEGISWPPSFIVAQKKPYTALVMEFSAEKMQDTALIVTQSSWKQSDRQLQRIGMSEIKEQTQYRLKGKSVLLQVGTCDKGIPCSRMSWRDDQVHYTVLLLSSPFELIRIAESMIR